MIASIALAVAIGNCPKPVQSHHRKKTVPVQSCVLAAQLPIPMCYRDTLPEPEELNVRPYYITVPTLSEDEDDAPIGEGPWIDTAAIDGYSWAYYGAGGNSATATKAPEINSAGAPAAVTLLLCAAAILRRL
jgi:hypothetical protein